jgi:hypothetical protein
MANFGDFNIQLVVVVNANNGNKPLVVQAEIGQFIKKQPWRNISTEIVKKSL